MTFYERLEILCEANNEKPTTLCKAITKSPGNLDTWKKGNARLDHIKAICDRYNCSADYLLGRTPCPEINISGNTQNNVNGDNNINVNNNDELAGELSSLLKQLDIRKRTELMTMIYNFVDNNKG